MSSATEAGLVQSVDRAVRVLEILAQRGEAAVTEIARELDVHKSTASRLVGVLASHDLVEQPGSRGKYRLGLGMLRLAGATAARLDLTTQALPVCQELAVKLGETTNVAVAAAGVAINICQAQGPAAVATQNWIGQRTPLHATSSGKVLLAYMREEDRTAIVTPPMKRFTSHTITSTRRLRAELRAIPNRGYGYALEELEVGLNAVAAPIRGHNGAVIAALSASGPAYRLTQDRLDHAARLVMQAATDISRRMGWSVDTGSGATEGSGDLAIRT